MSTSPEQTPSRQDFIDKVWFTLGGYSQPYPISEEGTLTLLREITKVAHSVKNPVQVLQGKSARVEHPKLGVHLSHCNFGEHQGCCKYGDEDCPALDPSWSWFGDRLTYLERKLEKLERPEENYERLYNAAKRVYGTIRLQETGLRNMRDIAIDALRTELVRYRDLYLEGI